VFFIPAFTAFTSSRLSLFVRPFTVGTEILGSLEVESLPAVDEVLEAVREREAGPTAVCVTFVTDAGAAAATRGVDDAALCESVASDPTGDGVASLLAAQAIETPANDKITAKNPYLLRTITHFSFSVDEFLRRGQRRKVIHKSGRHSDLTMCVA
jgi:hypothetical protein